jgi:ribonuclease-3
VTLSNWSSEEGGNFVNDLASNESLDRLGWEHALAGFIVKNPGQRGDVPRTTLASRIEAIIGAVWMDSGKDIGKAELAVEALKLIRYRHLRKDCK